MSKLVRIAGIRMNKDMHWLDHLRKYGWSVRSLIKESPTSLRASSISLSPDRFEVIRDKFLTWCITDITKGDIKDKDGKLIHYNVDITQQGWWSQIPDNVKGIFKHGIGHQDFMWEARESCIDTFSQIFNTSNLLCSFDGGCFLPPTNVMTKIQKAFYQTDGNWMVNWDKDLFIHCDQPTSCASVDPLTGKIDSGVCVQGLINLYPNEVLDGGLVLIPQSVSYYDTYPYKEERGHWKVNLDQLKTVDPDPQLVKVCAEEGDLVLWDSRMFHCNMRGYEGGNFRGCLYVSMMPKDNCPPEILRQRTLLRLQGKMTGHWCYGPCFDEVKYHNRFKTYPPQGNTTVCDLNERQLSLVG